MRFFFFAFIFILFIAFLGSCQKIANDGVPFYLKMDSVVLITDYNSQGDNTQNISDVWVQTNSTNLGAYELPCNFPVLEQNKVSFIAQAGIWESGQSDVREPYPFYLPDTFTINATPGQKYYHILHFRYLPSAIVAFSEDFESGGSDYSNMLPTQPTDTNNLYGYRCGVITVNTTDSDVIATQVSSKAFTMSQGVEAWLEVDYKCTVPFWIGFNSIYTSTSETDPYEVLLVVPKPNWSKLYIKMSDLFGQAHANKYTLFFEAIKPIGSTGGNVYIDNIKLVHF